MSHQVRTLCKALECLELTQKIITKPKPHREDKKIHTNSNHWRETKFADRSASLIC